jgi:hypothetical protein
LKHPFMIQPDGEIITPSLFLESPQRPQTEFESTAVRDLFQIA